MEAKLAALEEEINILKGEIKAILQEVRTAVLASENPFASSAGARAGSPASPVLAPLPQAEAMPVAEAQTELQPTVSAPLPASLDRVEPKGSSYQAAPREQAALPPPAADSRPTADVRALAALLGWVEETRARLDERRYRIVLGLASYGGLLDEDLERTLVEAGETVQGPAKDAPASMNDSIVALRQLEAILTPLPPESVRRLYEVRADRGDDDLAEREVRTSRRR
ncbi:MAG TPA: hypothetical protein VNN10_11025 [Dehalococcoidia bacterium]|nr:hypothetical protein [Dehalococcoidia bacterium]